MQMVGFGFDGFDNRVLLFGDFQNDLFYPVANFVRQDFLTVFGTPDQMEIERMSAMSRAVSCCIAIF